jgi:hypothetical protein
MPDSTNPNRGWFRYTDNAGGHWSMKVQKSWGESADSGFAAFNVADPVFPMHDSRNRPRAILCQNQNGILGAGPTFRTTKVRVGSSAATAWTTDYTFVSSAKGIAGPVDYKRIGQQEEHILRAHSIVSLPEPSIP